MKTKVFFLLIFMCSSMAATTSKDITVSVDELPINTQSFIHTYFSDAEFSAIKKIPKNGIYQLKTTQGWVFTFGKDGKWIDIDCMDERIPSPLIPSPILNKIAESYGTAVKVVKITTTRRGYYYVKLSNYIRLVFDKRYNQLKYK